MTTALMDWAMEVASREVAAARHVMVLVPNCKWACIAARQYKLSVWVRASTVESSLKSVPIDTLILVGRNHPDWNKKGEMYARERLKTCLTPRVLVFDVPEETKGCMTMGLD